jgi:hypothetical protein
MLAQGSQMRLLAAQQQRYQSRREGNENILFSREETT